MVRLRREKQPHINAQHFVSFAKKQELTGASTPTRTSTDQSKKQKPSEKNKTLPNKPSHATAQNESRTRQTSGCAKNENKFTYRRKNKWKKCLADPENKKDGRRGGRIAFRLLPFSNPTDLSLGILDVLHSRNLQPFWKQEDPTCCCNWLHILDTTCFLLRVPRMPSVRLWNLRRTLWLFSKWNRTKINFLSCPNQYRST